jgi:ligand-binding sensor domain-containing protein
MAADKYGNLYVKDRYGIHKFDGVTWTDIPNTPTIYAPIYLDLKSMVIDQNNGVWIDYLSGVTSNYDSINHQWIPVTHEGVAYFDGTNWTLYNSSNSILPDAPIYNIQVDYQNNVWVTTTGLAKFDGTNWTLYNINNSCLTNYGNGPLGLDSTGNVWLSDGHYGFIKFNGTNCTTYINPLLGSYPGGGSVYTDIDGSVWQMTNNRLIHFDGFNMITYNWQNSPLPNYTITCLSIDKYGNKWIGLDNGLLVYKQGGVISSISEVHKNDQPVTIFPNPFHDKTTFKINQKSNNANLRIINSMGEILVDEVMYGDYLLNINHLPSGVYFYTINDKERKIASGKLISY